MIQVKIRALSVVIVQQVKHLVFQQGHRQRSKGLRIDDNGNVSAQDINAFGGEGTNVTINNPAEQKEIDKAVGKSIGERVAARQDAGFEASEPEHPT